MLVGTDDFCIQRGVIGDKGDGRDAFIGPKILRGVPGFKGFQPGFELLAVSAGVDQILLDIVMLKRVLYPLFSSNLGDWLLEDPRMGPAAIFYLFYVGGVLFFASWPAFSSGNPTQALMAGALLGVLAYGTYEFTNFATLPVASDCFSKLALTLSILLIIFS